MQIETLDVRCVDGYAGHEQVVRCEDPKTGLIAFIAIHNTSLGPALGGIRMRAYPSEVQALRDVLRLSEGMSYKSALANLPLGGGKAVIVGNPATDRTPELLGAMGQFIDSLQGRYIGAEDSGTRVADMQQIALVTPHVAGIEQRALSDGRTADGDPSPSTAYGVFTGICASLNTRFGTADPDGVRVAVQGAGNVGCHLVKLLVEAGASVTIADTSNEAISRVTREMNVSVVDPGRIHRQPVDVYSPCALGGCLNADSISELQAGIVAGAANNQLQSAADGELLRQRGVLYAPDYVVNAGGIIDIHHERTGYEHHAVLAHIRGITETLTEIFEVSDECGLPTALVADRMAESKLSATSLSNLTLRNSLRVPVPSSP